MCINHRHRVYGILSICHVPVLYQITYIGMLTQLYENMWFCVWTTKWQRQKMVFTTKYFHIFVRKISIILNMALHFCPLLFTCPFFLFDLINQSMFECRIRQAFLKLSGQANILCTGYSVHNHLCVIKFSPGSCTVEINRKIIFF